MNHQSPTLASQATAELPKPAEWALQLAAQAWCEPTTSAKVMDEALATVFAQQLTRLAASFEADRASRAQSEWQPIETAPKYKEVLLWRADAGSFTGIFTSAEQFLSDRDQERLTLEDLELEDWFGGDYRGSWRLDGDEKPTHWMPLPGPATSGETK